MSFSTFTGTISFDKHVDILFIAHDTLLSLLLDALKAKSCKSMLKRGISKILEITVKPALVTTSIKQ
jgi:hypothetical protein